MDAVVTAGGRISGELAELTGQTIKCLIEFDGKRLIDRVLTALHDAQGIGRVCVVGPPEIRDSLDLRPDDVWVDDTGTGYGNFLTGLKTMSGHGPVLFSTSDLPFLTAEAVDEVIARCPPGYGMYFPIFTREEVRARFPHEANSYMLLQDGDMTGTSVMVMDPDLILPHEQEVTALFNARKNFVKLASLIGLGVGLRLLLTMKLKRRFLSVDMLLRRFNRKAGFPGCVVRGCSPVIGFDVDHERDWKECLAHLETVGKC